MSSSNDAENLTLQIENEKGVKIVSCAACGKEGEEDNMNICNKCKMVHYCNVACKKKHKSKHKKKCDRRVAELYDEALFKESPLREDCPICMMPLPLERGGSTFKYCCGKYICGGCIHAMMMEDIKKGKELEEHLCAFCRTPETSSDEEKNRRLEKLVEKGNAEAYYQLAARYGQGTNGMSQDMAKVAELLLKAGELGCAEAYSQLSCLYTFGQGVGSDDEKAKHYSELAAISGNVDARYNIGVLEHGTGNYHRAFKHFMVAARAGDNESLDKVKQGFRSGHVTKDEYAGTLRAYHESQTEMKSEARDKAAAAVEEYRSYIK